MSYNAKEKSYEKIWSEEEIESGKGLALLSYIPGLCFFVFIHSTGNRYIQHHAKQGLILFVIEVLAILFRWNIIWDALLVICVGFALLGMARAFSGRSFKIPIVSDFFTGLRG
ncbi:MAG: hypothetical protein N2450_04455 [bacterium]|nr:hypothetical protein [bacterium]